MHSLNEIILTLDRLANKEDAECIIASPDNNLGESVLYGTRSGLIQLATDILRMVNQNENFSCHTDIRNVFSTIPSDDCTSISCSYIFDNKRNMVKKLMNDFDDDQAVKQALSNDPDFKCDN